MWPESSEHSTPLRTGLTTGTCATACCLTAAQYLLQPSLIDKQPSRIVSVTLPRGRTVELEVSIEASELTQVIVSTVKDAGDDPDVTHGALISAALRLRTSAEHLFKAGVGVGTVTREGLLLAVGEPAINPMPRQMIITHLNALAKASGYSGGFEIILGVKNGEAIAQKTMNPRLGIIGGLSILGTTGIVRPFSCAAWVASIFQGIDVARANGITHIAASTGNSSEQAIQARYELSDMALIEMGDFVGAVLKHLKKNPVAKLSLCAGFGKLTKLAQGHMDLNSRASAINLEFLAAVAEELGGTSALVENIKVANTSIEALALCNKDAIPLAREMCVRALQVVKSKLPQSVLAEVYAIDRRGGFVGHAGCIGAGINKSVKDRP